MTKPASTWIPSLRWVRRGPGPCQWKGEYRDPQGHRHLDAEPPTTQNSNIRKRRIYRSVASVVTFTDYLLVADAHCPSFVCRYPGGWELGAVHGDLRLHHAAGWHARHVQVANGMCAGFAGNSSTWPEPYATRLAGEVPWLTTGHDIVAIAAIDTTLVIGTRGTYLARVSPASVTTRAQPTAAVLSA